MYKITNLPANQATLNAPLLLLRLENTLYLYHYENRRYRFGR